MHGCVDLGEHIRDDIFRLGHPSVMIRSDIEPALLQAVDTALVALRAKGVTASVEGSVPYDPQTNGAAENAVRLLKGSMRSNVMSFERQLRARISLDHTILTWLVAFLPAYVLCESEVQMDTPHTNSQEVVQHSYASFLLDRRVDTNAAPKKEALVPPCTVGALGYG